MKNKTDDLLTQMKEGAALTKAQRFRLVLTLSIPAILAQIASVVMGYIDAAMVGRLGAEASASISLVSSSTWLFGGMSGAVASGFSIQAAYHIGAGRMQEARRVMHQGVICALFSGVVLAFSGALISGGLPAWLGGAAEIREDASAYFLIYVLSLPVVQMNRLAGSLLQCSGDMRTPGILNILMCVEDVVFNTLLIFPAGEVFAGSGIHLPGAGLGVAGAALGTAAAQLVTAVLMLGVLCLKSPVFRLRRGESWSLEGSCIKRAFRLAAPIAWENLMMCGAMVASTRIVAPLGTVAIAANGFAISAESLCYMPGYGIAEAAATLTGQSLGAGRKDLTRKFSRLSVWMGMLVMAVTGALMFFAAPWMMAFLTPVPEVQETGAGLLRIEAFAEPLYGASIVVAGALRGAGDTLVPSIMNFGSIWLVRLPLAVFLTGKIGLEGAWIAMCLELCFRGTIFLIRLYREKWMKQPVVRRDD